MLETTIAGSLPKPAWLATPKILWAPWAQEGAALDEAKRDATLLALKLQEDAGIDIVGDGEQSRQHFVHGFLAEIEGIDFAKKVTMGIRNNRYEAQVPTVTWRPEAPPLACTRWRRGSPARTPAVASSSPCRVR